MFFVVDTLGERIRARRIALGMTFGALARKSGVSRGHLNNIEKGRLRAGEDVLTAVATALGLPPGELQAAADADKLGEERVEALRTVTPAFYVAANSDGKLYSMPRDDSDHRAMVVFTAMLLARDFGLPAGFAWKAVGHGVSAPPDALDPFANAANLVPIALGQGLVGALLNWGPEGGVFLEFVDLVRLYGVVK